MRKLTQRDRDHIQVYALRLLGMLVFRAADYEVEDKATFERGMEEIEMFIKDIIGDPNE